MLSHNNLQEQINKSEPTKQRFAIKKLTVGVASVLLGVTFAGTASADTADTNANSGADNDGAGQTDHTLNLANAKSATMKQAPIADNLQATVANPAGNVTTPVASGYEDAVDKAVGEAMDNASAAMAANKNDQQATVSDKDAEETVAKTEVFLPNTTPAADHAINTLADQKVQASKKVNNNVTQTYSIKVTAVDDLTGKAPVTSNYAFNYNFKNGVYSAVLCPVKLTL